MGLKLNKLAPGAGIAGASTTAADMASTSSSGPQTGSEPSGFGASVFIGRSGSGRGWCGSYGSFALIAALQ